MGNGTYVAELEIVYTDHNTYVCRVSFREEGNMSCGEKLGRQLTSIELFQQGAQQIDQPSELYSQLFCFTSSALHDPRLLQLCLN